MQKLQRAAAYDIREGRQIRALASIPRLDIVDALEGEGPCTVRELADLLDTTADTLYYHVKLLLKVGLLVKSTTDDGRLQVDVAGRPGRLIYDPGSRQNRQAVTKVIYSVMRNGARKFARAFKPETAVVTGVHRNLWAGHARARLTSAQLKEINHHLRQIISIMHDARGAQLPEAPHAQEFSFVMSPVVAKRRRKP